MGAVRTAHPMFVQPVCDTCGTKTKFSGGFEEEFLATFVQLGRIQRMLRA